MQYPLVSCLCCTYARPIFLGEAVKCFLDQDYPNKELIIVNDQENSTLKMDKDYDNIRIYNIAKRFESLGQKRNFIKSLANGDFHCVWDDDDLYAPFRISFSVDMMLKYSNYDIYKTKYAFMSTHNKDYVITSNLFHSQAIITKKYADRVQYPEKSVGEDIDFENKAKVYNSEEVPYYIYRWGLNVCHLSGIRDEKESWKKCLTFSGYNGINGEIVIKPVLQNNYWRHIETLLSSKNSNIKWKNDWISKVKKN